MSVVNASQLLETKPVGKLLLQYSIPAIIGMTVTSLYNIIDSIFIGHGVGPLAISGLAITFPLMNLIIAFCTLIGVGGATISSIYMGQRDMEKTSSVLGNVFVLCVILGFCFGGIATLFLEPTLRFFHRAEQSDAGDRIPEESHVVVLVDGFREYHISADIYFPFRVGHPGCRICHCDSTSKRAGMDFGTFPEQE